MKLEQEEEGAAGGGRRTPHVLVLPCPAQGHINPALQFSKLLAAKGVNVTMVVITDAEVTERHLGVVQVRVLPYSDSVSDEKEEEQEGVGSNDLLKQFRKVVKRRLPEVVAEVEDAATAGGGGGRVVCLVYDAILWWALGVARELNLVGAAFFTQSCTVDAIFCGFKEGRVRVPVAVDEEGEVSVEGVGRRLELRDLPSFFFEPEQTPGSFELLSGQFTNVEEADWVFCNSFASLEPEALEFMGSRFKFKPIGPTIPSFYLGKQSKNDISSHEYGLDLFKPKSSHEYGLDLFKPKPEANDYMKWLDSKEPCSVVYVSFGSLATVLGNQIGEVAAALKTVGYPFLWVVRESEESKLPQDLLASENGIVVSWCNQLEVLAHKSTGCFVTHCGWNSTVEALALGVPMVGLPQLADQTTNAKFVADIWRVGVRVKKGENVVVGREEIGAAVVEVMEGETGKGMRRNAEKWEGLARAAAAAGSCSEENIAEFVAELKSSIDSSVL